MNRPPNRGNRRQAPDRRDNRAIQAATPPAELRYPLPKRTVSALRSLTPRATQNPGLIFDRFAPDISSEPSRPDEPWKKQGLTRVIDASARTDRALLQAWNQRWLAAADAVSAVPFSLRTDWRLVAGLGRKTSYEVGFSFHRYGFPYLPGSSVKGLTRAAALWEIAEALIAAQAQDADVDFGGLAKVLSCDDERVFEGDFENAYGPDRPQALALARSFRTVFGTTSLVGGAVFLDAIPADRPRLELDIINPHYPDYYQGSRPPTAWQSPVPVYFLTVGQGTGFNFGVGWRGQKQGTWASLRDQAAAWLRRGLTQLGAGGKTSAGYGYFLDEAVRDETAAALAVVATAPDEGASEPPVPQAPTQERHGTVTEIRPDQRRGVVRDDETGKTYPFRTDVVRGNTPARRGRVVFLLQGDRVIEVRRM